MLLRRSCEVGVIVRFVWSEEVPRGLGGGCLVALTERTGQRRRYLLKNATSATPLCCNSFSIVWEAVAGGWLPFEHILGAENPADILTKPLLWHMMKIFIEPLLMWKGDAVDAPLGLLTRIWVVQRVGSRVSPAW